MSADFSLQQLSQVLAPIKEQLDQHGRTLSGLVQSVGELKQDVSVLKQDVSVLKQDVSVLKQDVNHLSKQVENQGIVLESHGKMLESHGKILRSHSKMLKSLKRDQNEILGTLDQEQVKQHRRIERIEDRLGIIGPVV